MSNMNDTSGPLSPRAHESSPARGIDLRGPVRKGPSTPPTGPTSLHHHSSAATPVA